MSGTKNRPAIADRTLAKCLRERYGLDPISVEFLPLGYDANAWVYRVDVRDGGRYFLKLKRRIAHPEILRVPYALRERGLSSVVAPLASTSSDLWTTAGEFALILYPFIDGVDGTVAGLTVMQWTELGVAIRGLHDTELTPGLRSVLPRATFRPNSGYYAAALSIVAGEYPDLMQDEISHELTVLLGEHREEIAEIVQRCGQLGGRLRVCSGPFVLCHADIHLANVLLDRDGHVLIVDWDQPMLAPRERDLMFITTQSLNGIVPGSAEQAAMIAGYGPIDIDPVALAYYRFAWAVEDIGSLALEIYQPATPGDGSRRRSLDALRGILGPSGIVAEALRADVDLT